jgi:2-hydroxychromene-2-carboxylate isomerase
VRSQDHEAVSHVEFFFDPMCPWAYQTSVWIRRVRDLTGLGITWRFFSLEEINRPEGKKHPWERPIAYGWTPMRVGAWLRRLDPVLLDRWYEACGRALHEEGRRFYDADVAADLLDTIGAPAEAWEAALGDPTTHDDVRADHDEAVQRHGGFGVPILVFPSGPAVFGPVVVPAPEGDEALALWDLTLTYQRTPGLFELKTPKRPDHLRTIARAFEPYLTARQWQTIQKPAP